MANPNPKNLLDDTGQEMLNAIRRILGTLAGTEPELAAINYRDNNVNMLDRTGKQLVADLNGIADVLASDAGSASRPASETSAGLMSPEDKRKLNAFYPADTYVTQEMLLGRTGVRIIEQEGDLPAGSEGEIVLIAPAGVLRVYDGQSWVTVAGPGSTIPESEVIRIIAEEVDAAGSGG